MCIRWNECDDGQTIHTAICVWLLEDKVGLIPSILTLLQLAGTLIVVALLGHYDHLINRLAVTSRPEAARATGIPYHPTYLIDLFSLLIIISQGVLNGK